MGKTLKVLVFTFLICGPKAAGAEFVFSTDDLMEGVYRGFQNASSQYDSLEEGFLESTTGFKYEGKHWNGEAKLLIRSLQSPTNTLPNDFAYVNLQPPVRLFNLASQYYNGQNQTETDAADLWLGYTGKEWQFSFGRRPLGIGVLRVLPVWNRLAAVLPTTSGYMLNQNPDLADIRWQRGAWTLAAFSVMSQDPNNQIGALELIHYGKILESHLLASEWWQQPTFGWSGVVDWGGATWRTESLIMSPQNSRSSGWQVGLGFEKALTSKLTALVEYTHSSFGTNIPQNYLLQSATPFRALLASDYAYPQLSYQFTDFWKISLGPLINLVDGSVLAIADTEYSFNDHVDIVASLRSPTGGYNQEFGYLPNPLLPTQTLQYAQWASAGIRVNF